LVTAKTDPVFGRAAASLEERSVDQLDQDPLIHVGLNPVGKLDQLAGGFLGISKRSIGGVFQGCARLECGEVAQSRRSSGHWSALMAIEWLQ
jgi:hypothetical protein